MFTLSSSVQQLSQVMPGVASTKVLYQMLLLLSQISSRIQRRNQENKRQNKNMMEKGRISVQRRISIYRRISIQGRVSIQGRITIQGRISIQWRICTQWRIKIQIKVDSRDESEDLTRHDREFFSYPDSKTSNRKAEELPSYQHRVTHTVT